MYETFASIEELLTTLKSRDNNEAMSGLHHSDKERDTEWAGTESYHEAEKLLRFGDFGLLNTLHENLKIKLHKVSEATVKKSQMIDEVFGSTPNVPNYLLGLPKDMYYRGLVSRKTRAVHILYSPTTSWHIEPIAFALAGAALLSVIDYLERNSISVRLTCLFANMLTDSTAVYSSVEIKDYQNRFNLAKLSFPLMNAAMFRRIGFKLLETIPGLSDDEFRGGYGYHRPIDIMRKQLIVPRGTIILTLEYIKDMGYDPITLVKDIKNQLRKKND